MAKTYFRADDGMIQDDQGRWIPPIEDNKDFIAAIQDQMRGEVSIVDAIDVPKAQPPAITADIIKALITDLKKTVSVDPILDQFVTDATAAVDAVPVEKT